MSVRDIPDAELVERAVRNAKPSSRVRKPRWFAVQERFGLGSTYAAELCRRFGLDPDEMVPGGWPGCERCEAEAREDAEAEMEEALEAYDRNES